MTTGGPATGRSVGVDAWAGRPVHVDTIRKLIAAGPTRQPPLPWET